MPDSLTRPEDSLERQNEKLRAIAAALMRRVEQDTTHQGAAYAQFERAALLEDEVRQRTSELEQVLELLNRSNLALTEARLEAENAHAVMSSALEAVQEGFALFDSEERLVMFNSRFGLHMPDVRAALTVGMAFADYVGLVGASPFLRLETPQERDTWLRERRRVHSDRHVMFNVELIRDRWLQVSEHRTPDGGTAVIQTDVTGLIRLERQKRGKLIDDQSQMLRATLDHLNQGVCIFGADGALADWNVRLRRMLGLPVSLMQPGTGFDSFISFLRPLLAVTDDDISRLRAWAVQDGARPPLSFEVVFRRNATLDVFAQELPDRGFVISFTDVTAEREAARDLAEANATLEARVQERTLELEDAVAAAERANASKSRFVAAASHDLMQPVAAAKLYMGSLTDGDGATSETAEKALNALSNVEHIIDALLNISRLDSGTAMLDVGPVSLARILNGLRDEFEPTARLKGVGLRVVPSDVIVISEPGYLRRILQNLIGNALKYTETGRVLVGPRKRGGLVRIDVIDTGPGIAEEDQERIFREFERLSNTTSDGLGLGLAIVERACAQLGHPLGVFSAPGRGTRFSVSLERVTPKFSEDSPRP